MVTAAVVRALGFALSLAKPPDKPPAATASSLGYLERGTDPIAAQALWGALALQDCEAAEKIPALKITSTEDLTEVELVGLSEKCLPQTFKVRPEAAVFTEFTTEAVDVTYKPAPSTGSATRTAASSGG
jgi:hypothetical protein